MTWTTTDLLTNIKRRMALPAGQLRLSDADLLSLATDEMRGYVAYLCRKGGRNYWIRTVDYSFAANTRTLRIPSLSLGATIEDIQWINSGGSVYKMDYVPMGQQPDWDFNTTTIISGVPQVFTIEGDLIYVLPRPSQAGTLRLRYERRQSDLVATSACWQVTVVGASTLTTATVITTGTVVDVMQADPDFDTLVTGNTVTVTGSGPYVATFTDSLAEVSVGDWMCPTKQTCIVPLPDILQVALAERTGIVALDIIGDNQGADRLRASLMEREPRIIDAITPRTRKSAVSAFQRNSILRSGRSRRGWNGWWG